MIVFLLFALVAGLAIPASIVALARLTAPIELALAAGSAAAWASFVIWNLQQVRRWSAGALKGTWLDAANLQVPGVNEIIPLASIEKVYWNPDLPYFVIALRPPAKRRYTVVRKNEIGSPDSLRVALEGRVPLDAISTKSLRDIADEWEAAIGFGHRRGRA